MLFRKGSEKFWTFYKPKVEIQENFGTKIGKGQIERERIFPLYTCNFDDTLFWPWSWSWIISHLVQQSLHWASGPRCIAPAWEIVTPIFLEDHRLHSGGYKEAAGGQKIEISGQKFSSFQRMTCFNIQSCLESCLWYWKCLKVMSEAALYYQTLKTVTQNSLLTDQAHTSSRLKVSVFRADRREEWRMETSCPRRRTGPGSWSPVRLGPGGSWWVTRSSPQYSSHFIILPVLNILCQTLTELNFREPPKSWTKLWIRS